MSAFNNPFHRILALTRVLFGRLMTLYTVIALACRGLWMIALIRAS
jgi:hypothetical protein